MASNVALDEDQQCLIKYLSATLDPNHEVRSFAEASLNQASLQPGVFVSLEPDFDSTMTEQLGSVFSDSLHGGAQHMYTCFD